MKEANSGNPRPKNMRLFLVRHGQTTANFDKTYAGQTDVPLTEAGRREAESLRPVLAGFSFDKVFSSDLCRAVDTQLIALPGIVGQQTTLLREYDVGALAGRAFGDIPAEYTADMAYVRRVRDYTPFGGENSQMVSQRLRKFFSMLEEDPCENVIAFVHGGLMSCALQIVLNAEFDRTAVVTNNCAIHVFEYDGTHWRLLAWNYKGEL